MPGDYNVRNALAAAAVALSLDTPFDAIATALGGFRGVSRRFQLHGEKAGVTVIDDYAHHPTEIAATIQAAHERYPGRRLVVLFQPHTYSRSQYLLEGFQRCFEGVDRLNLTATYAARERPEQGFPRSISRTASRLPKPVTWETYRRPLRRWLRQHERET